ncbi:ATP-binding protein [Vibrio sinaloensis]|uniref:ATP-binding protein n=1 Tax=Photobacterium sp. (strain ATCC 43367) TaxID=379097 RepID=UPI00204960FC|nr:ATP-binding protein [Vibrio sinaloensis]UPQ86781.1 ATP-binding protein [Vibrio sinaloensis]
MSLEIKEQLNEALIELKQSQAREARLLAENRAILEAISSITSATNKQQIFTELQKVLSLHIDFSEFIVLSKSREQQQYTTVLSSDASFKKTNWGNGDKFSRALDGECITLFAPASVEEFSTLNSQHAKQLNSALITGVKTAASDSLLLLTGNRAGQFSLESSDTLSRFRPLLERALIDIEHKEQLQRLVEIRTKQLKKAQQRAENANEAKSRFLAMMSHELRTPLNAVLGYIDVLLGYPYQKDQVEILEKMECSAELLLVLIDDILDLSRIESGEFPIKYQWVNLNSELSQVLEHFRELAINKGLQLDLTIQLDNDHCYWVDRARVMQIVFNLLGNAIKFTEHGQVALNAKLIENRLQITVVDTGIGIEASRLKTIFNQFKQADDSITRKYGGSGLGLAITKRLVSLMDGTITVNSVLGAGTTFTVELPVSIQQTATEAVTEKKMSTPKRLAILVVEDTETNQMVIKLVLERLGHQVKTLNNGKESVDFLKQNIAAVDVVFMDISMPVMDGITATQKIRQFCQQTPIIALTAHALAQDKQACMEAGMNAFVSKPIRSIEIQKSLTEVLSNNHIQ